MKEIKKEILHRIWELWELMPEQRFGQLLDNCVMPRNEDFINELRRSGNVLQSVAKVRKRFRKRGCFT